MSHFDWDIFVSDFKQRFLPPQFLTQLEDEFAAWTQSGRPVLTYSSKLPTLAQLIGTPEKEKLRAFTRGLDSSIKYSIRNLNPKTYEEALALAQNNALASVKNRPDFCQLTPPVPSVQSKAVITAGNLNIGLSEDISDEFLLRIMRAVSHV